MSDPRQTIPITEKVMIVTILIVGVLVAFSTLVFMFALYARVMRFLLEKAGLL